MPLLSSSTPVSAAVGSLLARRLGVALAGQETPVVTQLVGQIVDDFTEAQAHKKRAGRLRCLAALVRVGLVSSETVAAVCARLRGLLGKPSVPVAVRAEAWSALAEGCLRTRATDDFRVAFRYAMKHLSRLASMGCRVASVIVRAEDDLVRCAAGALKGTSGSSWPLRISGLCASAAVVGRVGESCPVGVCAQSIITAFSTEYGLSPAEWAQSFEESGDAKRRRLVGELLQLPDDDFLGLCDATKERLQAWFQARNIAS